MAWLTTFLLGSAIFAGITSVWVKQNNDKIDRFFMGVFRDLGRYKAKKRRMTTTEQGEQKGISLLSTLLHQDGDPLEDIIDVEDEDESHLDTYTLDELYEFGNGKDDNPTLLGILGRVYDVTEGDRFYGPGAPYEIFSGHDVTYSLSTGCRTMECVSKIITEPIKELSTSELNEAKRWLSFFHLHDKYPLVGKLNNNDQLEKLINKFIQEDTTGEGSSGSSSLPIMNPPKDEDEMMMMTMKNQEKQQEQQQPQPDSTGDNDNVNDELNTKGSTTETDETAGGAAASSEETATAAAATKVVADGQEQETTTTTTTDNDTTTAAQ